MGVEGLSRCPKDHVNTRMQHCGSKAKDKGDSGNRGLWDPCADAVFWGPCCHNLFRHLTNGDTRQTIEL